MRTGGLAVLFSTLLTLGFVGCSSSDEGGSPAGSGGGGVGGSSGAGAGAGSSQGGSSQGGSSQGGNSQGGSGIGLGDIHEGEYDLGPVAWEGSFWNSCAPYAPESVAAEGDILVGVGLDFNGEGQLCDSCIKITTKTGKSVVARVVTTGQTVAPNNVDLSQAAFDALSSGEYPRSMSWQVVGCPDTGNVQYQFQSGANEYWTSLWVRNHRWPLADVSVKSSNHPDFTPLVLGSDGTYTDGAGFGAGAFTIRLTAADGQVLLDSFDSFTPGSLIASAGQFQ